MHMKKQRGQTMVEFALVAPMIFLMIFGMIWGGFMFMEYLRFSNDVRAAARDIALTDEDSRATRRQYYTEELNKTYEENLPKLYRPSINIGQDANDEVIKITFVRRDEYLPAVLIWANFPPDKIPAIEYRMRREDSNRSSSTDTNSTDSSNNNSSGGET